MHALQGQTKSPFEHQLNSFYISLTPFLAQTLMPNNQTCQQILITVLKEARRNSQEAGPSSTF